MTYDKDPLAFRIEDISTTKHAKTTDIDDEKLPEQPPLVAW